MAEATPTVVLDPDNVPGWAEEPFEATLALSASEVETAQLEALAAQVEQLRPGVSALEALASREGIGRIESFAQAAPLLFDHRVYKSYPASLIEQRRFDRLTAWLDRFTTHDLSALPLDGVSSIDDWLERLDAHGMIMLHTSGTTGKLSFLPRSQVEWPGWKASFFESARAASGVDRRIEAIPTFYPGYRYGHATGAKLQRLLGECSAEGEENRHVLYEYAISSDLLSLAARLRVAEERGELDQLRLDPQVLAERAKLIEAGRRRDEDLEAWFTKLAQEFRGRRVRLDGVTADLIQLAITGREKGLECQFAPGSVLFTSGGFKGLRDVPDDWEGLLRDFFGIERISATYGMTECMGYAPLCSADCYHFFPYTVPLLLDADGNVLAREGVSTGRLAVFDLLAQTLWGGFITGDRVTIHWDDDCECGWRSPRLERTLARFAELEGGDDKITCAGTDQIYNEFMDYVSNV